MPDALHELSATALVDGYRQRTISPVEVTRAVLGHIERWEHHLQALYLPRPEQAMEQARASEARWLRGAALGPLDGVPITIKENIATQGDPVPVGTAATALVPAAADAPPAARMRESGAVL
uniref:amidase family protein n=1 Tax=Ramlibacter sp. TaxID=1917967 RepID=UPI00184EC952